eukprot:GHVR01035096.1.p1 GENE.GHVR01035096.1~~GHVR01035096.1.p1  ORF type:complete len:203 (+),score=26.80 GHVR01035096.1:2-610(+)
MADLYERTATSKLKLKGFNEKKSKKKKHKDEDDPDESSKKRKKQTEVEFVQGSGRIVTTTDTVHGFETKFLEEVQAGDVIHVFHPNTLSIEKRIIVGVLSQRSCTISESFSTDLVSTTDYHISKESILMAEKVGRRMGQDEYENSEDKQKLIQDEISKKLQSKIKKTKNYLSYREKTGHSYRYILSVIYYIYIYLLFLIINY